MSFLARLGVVLGLDTAEFTKGLTDSQYKLRMFENSVKTGMVGAGAAMAAAAIKVVKFADDIKDTAAASDVAMSAVLNVGHALQLAGGNAENAGKVLSNFNKVVGEAAMGDKAAQEMFKELGITLKDLSSLSIEQLFRKTSDALGQLDDNGKRVALAMQAFGRGIRGVDVKGFNEGLKEGHDLTKEQEAAFAAAAAAMDIWDNSVHNLKVSMVEFMGTGAASFIRFIAEGIEGIGKMIEAMAKLLRKFDEWNEKNSQFTEEYDAWSGRVSGESPYFKPLPTEGEQTGTGNRKVTPYKDKSGETKLAQLIKELETLKIVSKEYETQLKYQQQGIQLQTDKLNMTTNEAQVFQTIYDIEKKRAETVAALQDKRILAEKTGADKKVIQEIDAQIDAVNRLTDEYMTGILKAVEYNQLLSQSVEGGLLASYQKFQFDAINSAKYVEMAVDSVFGNMTNAINKFVETGKFDFADFTKSIIQDLIKIQMQMLLTALFAKAIGMGVSAFTNNALGPGFVGPPAPGRASGGDVLGGNPYYVGENGPELFIPSRSGTIIPNSGLAGLNNNQPQIVYNGPYIANMQAIDTQSATQFLARNKDAVYAANMSASRSMPTSVR